MFFQVISISALIILSVVNCEPPSSQYGPPINSYGTPNFNTNHNNNHDSSAPKSYEFGYQVKDDYSGNNYKRQEASDGNQVQGEYRVQLPDGRTQIVTYYADWQSGFHADVRYEGEASYPQNYGNGGDFGGGYGAPQHFGSASHGGGPSSQYGAPGYAGNFGNGFNLNNVNSPATSSVSIKDYSGPGTRYNVAGNYGGDNNAHNSLNSGYNFGNQGFDTYSHGFGNKARPSATYGAP